MKDAVLKRWALAGSALAALAYATGAAAQADNAAANANEAAGQLEEVVVTATRQSESVNRVPLSVTAQTQRSLDQQGIRAINDLVGTVPSLALTQVTPGVANVAIRGIQNAASANSQPTTGFYLDDTPLQKRNTSGFQNGNGTPLPPLFDLDRVEVLRGPQGTLFGGSSEGGTVRYITPTPSLTRYSAYIRGEASTTKNGDPSDELGIAVGGPILQDKLGFRASIYGRQTGGWIDYIDPYSGREKFHNANSGETTMFRGSLLWAPTEALRLTLAYFSSTDKSDSNTSSFTLPGALVTTGQITEQPVCFASQSRPNPFPQPVAVGQAACQTAVAQGRAAYIRPGGTFGPYPNLEPYDLLTPAGLSPAKTILQTPSLTIDYDFGGVSVKSITSYIQDHNRSQTQVQGNELNLRAGDYLLPGVPVSVNFPAGNEFRQGLGVSASLPGFGGPDGPYFGYSNVSNRRHGVTQEVRFSSSANARPLSWVAGVFYSNMHGASNWRVTSDLDRMSLALFGLTSAQRYGVPPLPDPETGLPVTDYQRYYMRDRELAGFVEANFWLTEQLRLTAGVRVSDVKFDFEGFIAGPASGFNVPTLANGGVREGSTKETPITPKFGAQYQFTDTKMVYVSAAKGFRAGGANPNLSPGLCNPVLSRFGLTTAEVPSTYDSDTVWSYEAGGKFRLFGGRVQLNGDVYRTDWKDIQTAVNFGGCGTPFLQNAGGARSQGFELEAQARLFERLSLNLAVGYTDAEYTETVNAPAAAGFTPSLIAIDGQKFSVPPWTVNVGARYEQPVNDTVRAYVRGDWRWSDKYNATPPVGVPGYSPDTIRGSVQSRVNARLGVEFGDFDVNVFVNNVFNAHDGNVAGGRSGCTAAGGAACTTFSQFNPFQTISWGTPRQVGFQVAYRH